LDRSLASRCKKNELPKTRESMKYLFILTLLSFNTFSQDLALNEKHKHSIFEKELFETYNSKCAVLMGEIKGLTKSNYALLN